MWRSTGNQLYDACVCVFVCVAKTHTRTSIMNLNAYSAFHYARVAIVIAGPAENRSHCNAYINMTVYCARHNFANKLNELN